MPEPFLCSSSTARATAADSGATPQSYGLGSRLLSPVPSITTKMTLHGGLTETFHPSSHHRAQEWATENMKPLFLPSLCPVAAPESRSSATSSTVYTPVKYSLHGSSVSVTVRFCELAPQHYH